MKITPWAKYLDRTQKLLTDVQVALETFEDEVGSLFEKTRSGAYKNFLQAYCDTLIPLWNVARFTSIDTVLSTIANLEMTDLTVMAQCLQPACPSSTPGWSDIIKKTKLRLLPNPNSPALAPCDSNSATRVLAAAVFSKLERHYFDEMMSCVDIASEFKCNVSQLSKALTGVDYASGPHHYKPKEKKTATKRTSAADSNPEPGKRTSGVPEKSEAETTPKSPAVQGDTLSSSSFSDELPPGLL